MIISASRRTDLPACYAQWFFHRLDAGFVYVRNPVNYHQVSRISLSPEVVDGIVFWTKNPTPMLDKLHLLKEYPYYFQFTLNAYGADMEPGIPSKQTVIIPAFQKLSQIIGSERVVWRYDPILLTTKYTAAYHIHYFEELAKRLSGYTRKCIISFVDIYRHLQRTFKQPQRLTPDAAEACKLAEQLSDIAQKYRLSLETCSEQMEFSCFGIHHGHCVDGELFERMIGQPLTLVRDKNQRETCGCMQSIDIGMYNSCFNNCRYCYANHSHSALQQNIHAHDPASPLLYGTITSADIVRDRKVASCKVQQLDIPEFRCEVEKHSYYI